MDESRFRQYLAELSTVTASRSQQICVPLRALHRQILQRFAVAGDAPAPEMFREWAGDAGVDAMQALAGLVKADLAEANLDTGRILGAYPFTATPRGYRVAIEGGPTIQAYCALDALGIPAMLDKDADITSRDPHSRTEIRIQVRAGQATWSPPGAVVTFPPMMPRGMRDPDCGLDRRCPTNGLRHLGGVAPPTSSALTRVRQRLGSGHWSWCSAFDAARRPPRARRAFAFGLRLVAWDGTGIDAADTPANAAAFGSGPQLRLLARPQQMRDLATAVLVARATGEGLQIHHTIATDSCHTRAWGRQECGRPGKAQPCSKQYRPTASFTETGGSTTARSASSSDGMRPGARPQHALMHETAPRPTWMFCEFEPCPPTAIVTVHSRRSGAGAVACDIAQVAATNTARSCVRALLTSSGRRLRCCWRC